MAPAYLPSKNCADCPIRHRAVCASCEAEELAQLENIKYYRSFSAGQTIVWAEEDLEFVASLVEGTAVIEQSMEDGRKQTVGLLLPSDFIGRPGRQRAVFTVTAVTDVTLCCFRRAQFEKLLETTPHIAQRLLEMALDELDAAREWMLLLGRKTAREKIATLLLMVQRRETAPGGGKAIPTTVHLPLTREAMADYLGLTIETVSRQLTQLRKDGLISIEGARRVTIPDVPALQATADYPDHP